MTAEVIKMIDSLESQQTRRFQWRERPNGYYIVDTVTGEEKGIGDGVNMFCPYEDDEEASPDVPGTQRFYNSLNMWTECEQQEIAKTYFGIDNA